MGAAEFGEQPGFADTRFADDADDPPFAGGDPAGRGVERGKFARATDKFADPRGGGGVERRASGSRSASRRRTPPRRRRTRGTW